MLDKNERSKIIELFESGALISGIAKKVGVSRQTVYNVIRDDFQKDPELLALEKELRKTELRKKIEELREPIETKGRLDTLDKALYELMKLGLYLWKSKTNLNPPECFYCGKFLKYIQEKSPEGRITVSRYECPKCKKVFPLL